MALWRGFKLFTNFISRFTFSGFILTPTGNGYRLLLVSFSYYLLFRASKINKPLVFNAICVVNVK